MIFLALAIVDDSSKGYEAGTLVVASQSVAAHDLAGSRRGMIEYLRHDVGATFIAWGPMPQGWEPVEDVPGLQVVA